MTRERGRGRRERGQSLVEVALVSFLLILLLVAVIDFARAFNSYVVITNASREGARKASRPPYGLDVIRAATKQEAEAGGVTLQDAGITVEPEPVAPIEDWANAQRGNPITVTVTYDFPTILGDIVGAGTFTLRARTAMVVFGPD